MIVQRKSSVWMILFYLLMSLKFDRFKNIKDNSREGVKKLNFVKLICILVNFIPFRIDTVSHGGFHGQWLLQIRGTLMCIHNKHTPCITVATVWHGPFHTVEFPPWLAEYSWTVLYIKKTDQYGCTTLPRRWEYVVNWPANGKVHMWLPRKLITSPA